VYRTLVRCGVAVSFLVILLASAPGQDKPPADKPPADKPPPEKAAKGDAKKGPAEEDYREFFKKPEKLSEYWDALQFELEVGRRDLAARLLNQMLKVAVNDAELVELDQRVGTSAFLRLRLIPKWSDDAKVNAQALKDADELTARVSEAIKKVLGDPVRIRRFIKDLTSDREDRAFAAGELHRAGTLAMPYLIAELQANKGEEHEAILALLPKLAPETVPPLIAALDIDDNALRLDLIDVLVKRNAEEAVPFLWYYAGSRRFPDRVRARATQALSDFTKTEPARLQPAPIALARAAERCYRHQPPLANGEVWRYDPKTKELVKGLPGKPLVKASEAEEYYGLRFAQKALDIDPAYAPAQQVLLSLVLEKGAERAGSLEQPLPKEVRELAATVNPELLNQVLERALDEKRLPVILGAVRALGDLAEARALTPTGHGDPALVRAASYPDRRVQLAAAEALLRIPAVPSPAAVGRVIDVLRRFAAVDAPPKAKPVLVLGFADHATADAIEKAAAGRFDVVKLASGRAVLERLKKSADVDAVLIDTQLPDPGLDYLLAQLRQDPALAGIPVWLVIPWDTQESLKQRQFEIEENLRNFRRAKQMLVDERARTESLYLKTKGAAATPFKTRLDRIDKELAEAFSVEKENALRAALADLQRQLLSARPAREPALRRLAEHYRLTWLLPESAARDPIYLGRALDQPLADFGGALSEAERKNYAERALAWLARMARGEITGYDFATAEDALYRALLSANLKDDALVAAIEATGRLPAARGGDRAQRELASVVTDAKRSATVRIAAARELLRRMQRTSPALTGAQVASLDALRQADGTDPKLREAVALVLGATRPDARLTGERLKGFEVRPPAPVPAPKEEKPPVPPKEDKPAKEDKP
jgi:CheY-like chemotaxis protein